MPGTGANAAGDAGIPSGYRRPAETSSEVVEKRAQRQKWQPSGLTDQKGNPVDQETMQEAQNLAEKGVITGMRNLFNRKGYHVSGAVCGAIASKYASAAGYKPPQGSAIATNWHNWGEQMKPGDINAPGHPVGSMFGTYTHGTYGGHQGQLLKPGDIGGHVGMLLPGSYDPKTNSAMFVDQSGAHRRNLNDVDTRFAGADAVQKLAERAGKGNVALGPRSCHGNGREPRSNSGHWPGRHWQGG